MRTKSLAALHLALAAAAVAGARMPRLKQRMYQMTPSRKIVYKKVPGRDLELHVFEPEGLKPTDKRPAIVFFFGGGWVGGSPVQFYPQCKYLASRGMVAISAVYRTRGSHGTSPFECVADGKSAVRWVRANAPKLGVDPDRIAAGGGSAGGHVAACTGTIEGLDEKGEDTTISSRPNAMVLFNPALLLDPDEFRRLGLMPGWLTKAKERFGDRDMRDISPWNHVRPGVPPTIIFHGKADRTVPFVTAEAFARAMKKAGNRCELVGYEGKGHGFFNFNAGQAFYDTMAEADKFLVSLGYLKGPATLDEFRKSLEEPGQ